ncbi:ribonucleotide reductase inhibitor-domain-containing protein [Whalleya microplaca]|nr:ribonucleotide reductase inhibitor-domain-containing protein [Whalleya microplaca]
MSAPRTKRQFAGAAADPAQRSITSFFSNSSTSSLNPRAQSTSPNSGGGGGVSSPPPPPLPASVQSNLLSVGMRVRKSVPEGYKTGNLDGAFALWDDDTDTSMGVEGRSRANAVSAPGPRELLPFCGLHRVGGLDAPPSPMATLDLNVGPSNYMLSRAFPVPGFDGFGDGPFWGVGYYEDGDDDDDDDDEEEEEEEEEEDYDDDVPGLTSSQESMASTASVSSENPYSITTITTITSSSSSTGTSISTTTNTNTRKRPYTEDAAPGTPDRLTPGVWRGHTLDFDPDGEVSPRTLAPAGWRAMAVPRTRMRRSDRLARLGLGNPGWQGKEGNGNLDQENFMVVDADEDGNEGGDFEEAGFLDRELRWEVEMSDV